jgi:hypothetical protein
MSPASSTIGQRVRVERDETLHPPRGTWPKYRGRTGTVVAINMRAREIGVLLGAVRAGMLMRRPDGRGYTGYAGDEVTWFEPHELRGIGDTPHGPVTAETGPTGLFTPDEPEDRSDGRVMRLTPCVCGRTLTTNDHRRLSCCDS